MKTQELKVGDSFEVVKVISNYIKEYSIHVGKNVVKLNSMIFSAYLVSEGDINLSYPYSKSTILLSDSEVKPIGKLTITKVK